MGDGGSARPKRKREDDTPIDPSKKQKIVEGKTDRPPWYSSTKTGDDVARHAVEKRLKKNGHAKVENNRQLFECCYCKGFYEPKDLEIEHIHPYSEIGKQANSESELEIIANDTANLSYACGTKAKGCNQSQSDKLLFDYLGKDQTKYKEFLEQNDAKWMDPGISGSMNYMPPYKRSPSCEADKPSADDAAYQAQLEKRKEKHGDDLRPRPPIGRESCYHDLDGRPIGPVKAVDECCARAAAKLGPPMTQRDVLKEVLNTSSNQHSKFAKANYVIDKKEYVQEICWQTIQYTK
jgi:5-methylcytosine-specific restriction endonuclease McrA